MREALHLRNGVSEMAGGKVCTIRWHGTSEREGGKLYTIWHAREGDGWGSSTLHCMLERGMEDKQCEWGVRSIAVDAQKNRYIDI